MNNPICGVLIHVSDVAAALTWYAQAFPGAVHSRVETHDFDLLTLDGVQIELARSDQKVGSGAAGSVVYWRVPDLSAAIAHFAALGAPVYRGPMQIDHGLSMCQVRDPWGNCIGLRGPMNS